MTRFVVNPALDEEVARRFLAPRVERLTGRVEEEAKRLAPPAKVWITMRDERVRASHVHTDGQEVPDNLRFKLPKAHDDNPGSQGWDLARQPRDPELPVANRINCFPADTLVQAPGLRGGYRRWYEGRMVTIRTASGRTLTGTPNHPVLTERGWVALGEIEVGRDRVQAVVGDLIAPAGSEQGWLEPDVERAPAEIGEVLRALADAHLTERMAGSHVDFHGDGLDGDVYVVRPHRELQHRLEAATAQPVGQGALVRTDSSAGALPGAGLPGALLVAGLRATAGLVRGCRPLATLLGGGGGHAGRHRLSATARLHASVEEGLADMPAARAGGGGKGLLRLAPEVTPDEIVARSAGDWAGHVYNLETAYDSYVANGLVVHNCRCEAPPVPEAVASEIHRGPVLVMGTKVAGTVVCTYPRAAEAEYGTDKDTGAHFMSGAINRVATETKQTSARRT